MVITFEDHLEGVLGTSLNSVEFKGAQNSCISKLHIRAYFKKIVMYLEFETGVIGFHFFEHALLVDFP